MSARQRCCGQQDPLGTLSRIPTAPPWSVCRFVRGSHAHVQTDLVEILCPLHLSKSSAGREESRPARVQTDRLPHANPLVPR